MQKMLTYTFGIIVVVIGLWFARYILIEKGILAVQQQYNASVDELMRSGHTFTCVAGAGSFEGTNVYTVYTKGGNADVEVQSQVGTSQTVMHYYITKDTTYAWKPGEGAGAAYARSSASASVPDWSTSHTFNCTTQIIDDVSVSMPTNVKFTPAN